MKPDVVFCPADVTVTEPAGTVQATVTWDEPMFYDAVSKADLDIQQSKQSGSNFTVGSTQVLYSAMDGKFNAADCTFTVTLNGEYYCTHTLVMDMKQGTTESTWHIPLTSTQTYCHIYAIYLIYLPRQQQYIS